MPTVRSIAKKAGVSITTVSRVLNNNPNVRPETREKVLAAANQARYQAKIGRRSTSNIAYLYTDVQSLGAAFDAAVMQGMSQALENGGFDLLVLSAKRSRRSSETFSQLFMRKGVRGAVVRTTMQTHQICREIAVEGFPAVVVGDVIDDPNVHCIDADSFKASQAAVEHLIHLGHRRIAVTLNIVDDYDHMQRLKAYRAALGEAGIAFDPRLVLRVPAYREAGAMALKQMMAMRDRPTAVYVTDPLAAVGLIHEAHRRSIDVPGQLSVVGFDDSDLRFGVYPQMSAVCQDVESLGRVAVARLMNLINSQNEPVRSTTDCWFEVHDSSVAPPVQRAGVR